jgi:hypothetical protein
MLVHAGMSKRFDEPEVKEVLVTSGRYPVGKRPVPVGM